MPNEKKNPNTTFIIYTRNLSCVVVLQVCNNSNKHYRFMFSTIRLLLISKNLTHT